MTGRVFSLAAFNREENSSLSFVVYARDNGEVPRNDSATVTVTILDRNDNAPIFVTVPRINIREDEPVGRTIGRVTARDDDELNNQQIRYAISGGSGVGVFDINEMNGDISIAQELNFENVSAYDLTVVASDRGDPSLSSNITLVITIRDSDDHDPLFTRFSYNFMLAENNTILQRVGRVVAVDVDPLNRSIGYNFSINVNPNIPFAINSTTGEIFATEVIEREPLDDDPRYTFEVVTYYVDVPSVITDNATVTITILDINDVRVEIQNITLMNVTETMQVDQQIGRIEAFDSDPDSVLEYSLTISGDVLRVNSTTGRIYINGDINRENPALFPPGLNLCPPDTPRSISCIPVFVRVVDLTTNDTDAALTYLFVIDIDDEPPVFNRQLYTTDISENVQVGDPLTNLDIRATDPDFNISLMYSISDSIADFAILPFSGLIIVSQSLDYETTQMYNFTILVTDSRGNQDSAIVVINVLDVNDNNPIFDRSFYNVTIPENYPIRDVVAITNATDLDSTTNGRITYRIIDGNEDQMFSIDQRMGAVSLIQSLDREVTANYSLTIEASDAGMPIQRTATVQLDIYVRDVLDHPPRFLQTNYVGFVSERADVGDPILDGEGRPLVITYEDLDIGDRVTVLSFTFGAPIMINGMNGAVTVAGPLDFEQETNYMITVILSDLIPLYSAPATVSITVLPVNDHPPEFDRDEYTVQIEENSREGEVILQVAAQDLDANDIVSYSIVSTFNSSDVMAPEPGSAELLASGYSEEEITFPFEINNSTGEITLLRTLDYEVLQEWPFIVVAMDPAGLNASTRVTVAVEDLNDNAPRFTEHVYRVSLQENTTITRAVPVFTEIEATDLDSVSTGRLQYFILSGGEGLFEMNRDTAYLYLVDGPLDPTRAYTLQIHVTDGAQNDAAQVRVHVTDINNNAPIFVEGLYSASIAEDAPIGTFVVRVEATDMDQHVFSDIKYYLISSEYSDLFYIDELTGEVYTNSTEFDFDIPPQEFTIYAEAVDGATPPRRSTVNVTIMLEDVNDNTPVFDRSTFTVTIPEATRIGTSILRITARDSDSGINKEVFFHFPMIVDEEEVGSAFGSGMNASDMIQPLDEESQESMFILEPDTGILRVNSTLDYDDPEAPNPIILTVLVTDRGNPPLTSNATVEITLTDSNDNDPYFNDTLIRELVPEDSEVGDLAFTVQAYDIDSGRNQELTYDILSTYPSDCNSRFRIMPNGSVFLNELVDAEARGEPCTMIIEATDGGSPPRSGQATFVVIVTDINEHPPTITPESLRGSVLENSPSGTFVLQIMTSDLDGNTVTVTAVGEVAMVFDVTENGTVTVAENATLDRELIEHYLLTVNIMDDGLPEMTVQQTITIFILDENDNPPIFDRSLYTVSVREDHPLTSPPILIVQATDIDIDSNAEIVHTLISNDDNETDYDIFAIDDKTGEIYLTSSLDYEMEPRFYSLRVQATDGVFTTEANVTVQVLEANDITPSFTNLPNITSIPENLGNGSFVYTAMAIDMDQGVNGRITYTLQGSDKFAIDSVSGEIFVYGDDQFDFDRGQTRYTLIVTATDNAGTNISDASTNNRSGEEPFINPLDRPRNMSAELIVLLTDVNDLAPQFTEPSYTALIVEHDQVPLLVSSVEAFDEDQRDTNNSIVRYRIISGDFGRFDINDETGVITTIPPIDREAPELSDGPSYTLLVEAYDLGIPSLSSRVVVTVTVIDTNDERPVFTVPVFVGSVNENSPPGTSVLTVSAIDPDNFVAPLNYSLFETQGYFVIDLLSGEIFTTARNLDREEVQNVSFTAQAVDQDGFVATANVIVDINDVNDEAPKFEQTSYTFTISEDAYNSFSIGRVVTSDIDSPENSNTEYLLPQPNVFFDVDMLDGVIRAIGDICLDQSASIVYTFDLVARDVQDANLNNTVPVTVTVLEQNLHPPVFVRPSYISRLDEAAPQGTVVLEELETTDGDGCSGPPIFEIIDGNVNDTFQIDSSTGRIILTHNLSEGDLGFTLTLKATDTANYITANMSSEVTLIVLVGQLLPVSIAVQGGFTVPAISRFSQEEYQQDIWLYNGGSEVTPDPIVRYSLGNIVTEQRIASNNIPAISVRGEIAQTRIYRGDPYIRVGLQVEGEGYDKVSVRPTEVYIEAISHVRGTIYTASCTTQPPSAICVAEAQVPIEHFSTDSTAEVFYGLSPDDIYISAGNISIVETAATNCPPLSSPYVRAELPHKVLYPGNYYDIVVTSQTDREMDAFQVTCTASEGLEFVAISTVPTNYAISTAASGNVGTINGLRNQDTTGLTQFEIGARLFLQPTANIVSDELNITCNVDYIINVDNIAELYDSPAIHSDYASCSSSTGTVLAGSNTAMALFSYPRYASLLNTAVLNGREVESMLNVVALTGAGTLVRNVPQLTCTSRNNAVLKVESDCSRVYLDGNETSDAVRVNIEASSTVASAMVSFRVWYPTAILLAPDVVELSPIQGLYTSSNETCTQAYEYLNLDVEAAFVSGDVRQPVSIGPQVGDVIESSNENVLRVEFDSDFIRLVGVSTGQAYVRLIDSQGLVYTSPNITVTDTSVSVEDLSLSLYSSLVPRAIPSSIPGTPYLQTALVALNADLEHIDVELEVIPEAVLSNNRNYQLTLSNGLVLNTSNPETIIISGDLQVTVRGSGTGQFLQGRIQNSCSGSEVFSTSRFIDISVNPVESVNVAIIGPTIVSLVDDSDILNTPFQTSFTVELVHQDGTRVNATNDPRLQFESEAELIFSNSTVDVSNITSAGMVNFTVSYSYDEGTVVSDQVYIEVVGIQSLSLTASPYSFWPDRGTQDLLLEKFRDTVLYQQAELTVMALLSNGSQLDISSSSSLQYENNGDAEVVVENSTVVPLTAGNASIVVYIGSRLNDSIELQVNDSEVYAVEIADFSIPMVNSPFDILNVVTGTVLLPTVMVRYSDGTYNPRSISPDTFPVPNVLELTSSDPDVIEVNDDGTITVQRNSKAALSVTASLVDGSSNVSLPFIVDLVPNVGEVDIVTDSLPPYLAGTAEDLRIIANIDGYSLGAAEFVVYFNSSNVQFAEVFAGSDLPDDHVITKGYGDTPGSLRFGGIFPSSVNGTTDAHIFTLPFLILQDIALTDVFNIQVMTLAESDYPYSTIGDPTPRFSRPASFSPEPALPDSIVPCSSPPCSQDECEILNDISLAGDTNGDCVFNLVDALYAKNILAQLNLPGENAALPSSQLNAIDANKNGVYDPADIRFLVEGRMGRFPLVRNINLLPVDLEGSDCVLSINVTLQDWNGSLNEEAFMYFGLFHNDPSFQTQYDDTSLSSGVKLSLLSPADQYGGWIETENHGLGTYGIRTEPGNIAQRNIGFILVYGTLDTNGDPSNERTQFLFGLPSIPSAYDSLSVSFTPIQGRSSVSTSTTLLNPLTFFDNTINESRCYNNFAPVINPDLPILIVTAREDDPVGHTLRQVSATDRDAPLEAGNVRFSLEDVEPPGAISIENTPDMRGTIYIARPLDRELSQVISATIVATDQGPHIPTRMRDTLPFRVNIRDVNDNPPIANESFYSVRVLESLPLDVVVDGRMRSAPILQFPGSDSDVDTQNNMVSSVRVTEDNTLSTIFAAGMQNSQGDFEISLYLIQSLDRERQDMHNLTLTIIDSGLPSLSSSVSVQVEVIDANDVRPEFTSPERVTLTENNKVGVAIVTVAAVDNDLGSNAIFNFTLNSVFLADDFGEAENNAEPLLGYFILDPKTGEITANRSFDREDEYSFQLNIIAEEEGIDPRFAAIQNIWVMICDENDNQPLFDEDIFFANVPENSEDGYNVTTVNATDADLGSFCPNSNSARNNIVQYELLTDDVPFIVVSETGDILVNGSLDFESSTTQYDLQILAYDLGVNSLSSTTNLTIYVTDVNDNSPVLNKELYYNVAVENSTVGTIVIDFIEVTDDDSEENQVVNFSLEGPGSGDFSINRDSGVISIAQSLDRERQAVYNLTVVAFNPENPDFNDTAEVRIVLIDINDSPPVFNATLYAAEISENTVVGDTALRVFATDADANRIITYQLAEPSNEFRIDPDTGEIFTQVPLCTPRNVTYELTVTALDRPGGQLTLASNATVTILVYDDNRFSPYFTRVEYVAIVEDGLELNELIQIVEANDDDLCSPPFTYSIVGTAPFRIDNETGVIYTAASLSETEYFIVVEAMDSGTDNPRSGQATVIVLVGETVPVGFATDIGFKVAEPRRVPGNDTESNFYEQQFDFFYDFGQFDRSPSVQVNVSYGDTVLREDVALAKQPATRVNAVLLTPTVPYDNRFVQVAMAAVDQYGSNRVDEAIVYVTASTEIDGKPASVQSSQQTAQSLAIVSVELPLEWFYSARDINITYGVENVPQSVSYQLASILPFPNFDSICPSTSSHRLVVLAPSYSLYANQVVDVPVVALQSSEYSLSAAALQCTVGSGTEFSLNPVSAPEGWEVGFELNTPRTQLEFTVTRQEGTTSPPTLEFVAQISISVQSNSINSSTITCIRLEAVDTDGKFGRFSEALMVDSNGCQAGTGQVTISRDVLVGALPVNTHTVIVNDAVLSGNSKVYFPSVIGVYLSAQPTISSIIDTGQQLGGTYTCTSAESSVLKVDSNCGRVYIDGTETGGADTLYITVSTLGDDATISSTAFPIQMEYHVWYPDLPLQLTASDTELSPIEGWLTGATSSAACSQEYQRADIYATATFRLGTSSVSLRVEHLLTMQSTAPEVASISNTTVVGQSPGTTTIFVINNRRTPSIIGTFPITCATSESSVRAIEFDTIFASDFSLSLPEQLSYSGSQPLSATIDPNLWYETQTAALVSTAVFSDATRLQVTANDGLSYTSLNTSIIRVSGSTLTAVSSGSGELLQVTWNTCNNSEVLSQNSLFDISLLVPDIRVSVPSVVLVHSSDPAASLTNISTSVTIRVEQVSTLRGDALRTVDITSKSNTVYSFSPAGILSIATDGIVSVVTPNVNANVTLTISIPSGASTTVTFYTVHSLSLSTSPSPYPAYPNSDNVQLTVLHPIANTGVYQRAQILSTLTLATPDESIQSEYDVSGHQSLQYSTSPSNIATVSSDGLVIPSANGNIRVSISAPPLQSVENMAVIASPTLVSSIDRISLSSGGNAIVGRVGDTVSETLSVGVSLSDGTRIEEVFTPAGQVYPGLLTVVSNDPALFTVNPITGQLTILGSRHTSVSVTITTNQNTNIVSQRFSFYINLEPAVGELDLGSPVGQPVPPVNVGEEFSVLVRLNLAQSIAAFEVGVAYSSDTVELLSVSVGSDLPSDMLFESSLREFQGYVYFGGITDSQPINSGIVELAVLTFRAGNRNDRFATISGEIISLLGRSQTPEELRPAFSSFVSVGVLIGSEIRDTALPDVALQRDTARAALAPTVTPCAGGVPIDGNEMGDLNGDCVFNISDVLQLRLAGCVSDSNPDFNMDGICNERDITFLLRANYRIVQFISNVAISPVDPMDCFLTIDVTLRGRGTAVANGARTNLLYGLFHRDEDFQQQFDTTSVFIGIGTGAELRGSRPPSTNGGFFNALETGPGGFRVVLNTPISTTDIGLVLVQARVDGYGTLMASRTEVMSGYPSIPIRYPEYINATIVHSTGVDIPFQFQLGFNPLQFFDQTFTSPNCINEAGPQFFPNTTRVEVYEDITNGSLVAVVFANDSDAGPNAEVMYSFYAASDVITNTFEINETTGEVYLLSTLNREVQDVYFIGLQALDRGIVSRRGGIGELIVRVLDINDEAPTFEEDPYLPPSIREDATKDSFVVNVQAIDDDLGPNGTVSYMLLEPKYVFEVNSTTGDIFTTSELDYETEQQYNITVVATDNGSPSLSGSTTVIINVEPVNDNTPECYPTERLALVSENENNGTSFFLINVTDADIGADHNVLNFALAETSNEFSVVKISDTLAALVTITEDFNRLLEPLYNVTVIVSDVDGQSCSIQVSIRVVEPPAFDFAIERPGAGFFSSSIQQLRSRNGFVQEVSFFGNSFNSGSVSGSLSGQSDSAMYTRSPQPPTRLDGILHEDEVWPDNPIIAAAIQLRDDSFNTIVDETDIFLQIQPIGVSSTTSPVTGTPCEREEDSLSGICAAEVVVPASWFSLYSNVSVTAVTSSGVSISLGEVGLMPITVDISEFKENLVIELPSYTVYPNTSFTIWVGASPLIDIKAIQFSLDVPSSIELHSIIQDEKWGCTQEDDDDTDATNFVCFRALAGVSQTSLIGTDRFFGVQASVREEVTDFENVNVHAVVTSIASPYGSIISAPRPALVFTRNNISLSPGSVNLQQTQVRGIFASTERPELVNTVPLNGVSIEIPITAYAVYNRLYP